MSEIDDRFQLLRERFLDRCVGDLPLLEAAATDPASVDRSVLRERIHRLAGAAGTFGFPELSRLAGEADDALMAEWAPFQAEVAEVSRALQQTLAER